MVAVRRTYTVNAARHGDWWAISVDELPGVFSQARRLDQVGGMARDAIALFLDLPPTRFDLSVRETLAPDIERMVAAAKEARAAATAHQQVASERSRAAARTRCETAGSRGRRAALSTQASGGFRRRRSRERPDRDQPDPGMSNGLPRGAGRHGRAVGYLTAGSGSRFSWPRTRPP